MFDPTESKGELEIRSTNMLQNFRKPLVASAGRRDINEKLNGGGLEIASAAKLNTDELQFRSSRPITSHPSSAVCYTLSLLSCH